MYRIILPLFLLLLVVRCSDGTADVSEIEAIEFLEEPKDSTAVILTISGAQDEMDGYFYIYVGGEIEDQEILQEVHIVPEVWEDYNDSSDIQDFMMGIATYNFDISYQVPYFTGTVIIYYDALKKNIASTYKVINGKPDGEVVLVDPESEIVVQRTYESGECVSVEQDVFSIQWKLDQKKSNLSIENASLFTHIINDSFSRVDIGPSVFQENNPSHNFENIIDKKTFKDVFKINNVAFSGELNAYYNILDYPSVKKFELRFKDGWLHDTIRIWNDWGEIQLIEVFNFGELDSTLYVMEENYEDGVAKPIIYLYPERDQIVNVSLNFKGDLTTTYPNYPEKGWTVLAKPDGTLIDGNNRAYYALFWEGNADEKFTMEEGFVVKGDETALFLEKTLPYLGLNERETNEFIIYWLPLMERNPYNFIHFSTDEYEDMAQLKITPKPATIIRVMMVWSPLEDAISIPAQDLSKMHVTRKGFTVVEWGGRKQNYTKIAL